MQEITSPKIKYPNFKEIINECKKQMKIKFPDYGNSWDDREFTFGYSPEVDNEFWKKRLKTELKEFLKSNDVDDAKKELIDIINIACMIYEKSIYYRDPNWRYG